MKSIYSLKITILILFIVCGCFNNVIANNKNDDKSSYSDPIVTSFSYDCYRYSKTLDDYNNGIYETKYPFSENLRFLLFFRIIEDFSRPKSVIRMSAYVSLSVFYPESKSLSSRYEMTYIINWKDACRAKYNDNFILIKEDNRFICINKKGRTIIKNANGEVYDFIPGSGHTKYYEKKFNIINKAFKNWVYYCLH